MSTETQNNALESAEPVGKVIGHELSMSGPVPIISWHHTPMSGAKECPIPVGAEIYLPPVAAQAQPTRRELDMAMLIKNLARQVRRAEPYGTNYHRISDDALDALKRWGLDGSPVRTTKPEGTQSQQVDKSTEMQRQLVDRTPDLHRQQQPESSADGLTDAAIEVLAKQYDCHNSPGFKGFARAVAALAQQDADKVDAERYRWLRDPEKQSRDDDVISWVACRTLDDLDAAIDEARKEQA